jgi:Uma2 family endonuclease
VTAAKTLITAEEYQSLPETQNGVEYEMRGGELVVLASPTLFHNWIRDDILERLRVFRRQNPDLGQAASEVDFWLTGETVRRPDVAFIGAAKLRGIDPREKLEFAPDLAIEIASPHDDLPRKIQDYVAAGARIWALYPEARIARIHKPGESAVLRDAEAGDCLQDTELLPGFSLPLAEVLP